MIGRFETKWDVTGVSLRSETTSETTFTRFPLGLAGIFMGLT